MHRDSRDDIPSTPGSATRYNSSSSSYYGNASYASTAVSSSSEARISYLDTPSLHYSDGCWESHGPTTSSFDGAYSSLDEAFSTNQSTMSSVISRKDSFAESGFSFSSEHGGESGRVGTARTGRVIRIKDSGVSFRFPLDENHLPSVQPSPEQYAAMKKRALTLAEQSMNSSYLWLKNPTVSPELKKAKWKVHAEKKNCVVFRQRGTDTKTTQSRTTITRAKLYATLEEVAYAIHCDNTEEQRSFLAHCYQDSFLDGAVLDVAETATPEDPLQFLGIKWLAFQSSMGSGHVVVDALVFEFSKTLRDAKGQKVLARVCQSVNLDDFEGSEHNFGFVRSQISWVNLFRWTGTGCSTVDVMLSASTQYPANAVPSWLGDRVVSGLPGVVSNLAAAGDAKYAVKNRLITGKAWVRNSERSACSVCYKSFSLLRSRHHCRICAEIMCSTCTMELTIRSSELPASLRPHDTGMSSITSGEKFCLSCINLHRAERRNHVRVVQARRAALRSVVSDGYDSISSQSDEFPQRHRSVSDADSIMYQHRSSEASYVSNLSDGSTRTDKSTTINGYIWSAHANASPPGSRSIDLDENARIANLDGLTQKTEQLRVRSNPQHVTPFIRHRQGSGSSSNGSATESSINTPSSATSTTRPRGPQWEKLDSADDMVLLEEPEDVESIRAIPTTFIKMEEAIAAQQALLRNMIIEGHKIMRSNGQQQPQAHHRPRDDYPALE